LPTLSTTASGGWPWGRPPGWARGRGEGMGARGEYMFMTLMKKKKGGGIYNLLDFSGKLFYWFFMSVPTGYNYMLDFFKEYAREVGMGAILGDSFMMILACLLSSHFAIYSLNTNIIILIVSTYFIPYMINYV
jgi:hypothetical protein